MKFFLTIILSILFSVIYAQDKEWYFAKHAKVIHPTQGTLVDMEVKDKSMGVQVISSNVPGTYFVSRDTRSYWVGTTKKVLTVIFLGSPSYNRYEYKVVKTTEDEVFDIVRVTTNGVKLSQLANQKYINWSIEFMSEGGSVTTQYF